MRCFSQWDFTLATYTQLCKAILESHYAILNVAKFLEQQKSFTDKPIVILRHDVDRRPDDALAMASVEAGLGISATYYFRAKMHTFKAHTMREIVRLGHEIGYHYEDLSDTGGDMEKAIKNFAGNLKKVRDVVPVKTICMHGKPLSRWDNRDLWKIYDYKDFDIIGEPYFSLDCSDMVYLSDTGRSWVSGKYNIRDTMPMAASAGIRTTADLIKRIRTQSYRKIHMLCHPERWSNNLGDYCFAYLKDSCANVAKCFLRLRV